MNQSTIDLLLTRRSVLARDMIPPGPTAEELDTILRCGLRVPDHSRAEPWRIQVLDKPAQKALGDLCAELFQREHPEVIRYLGHGEGTQIVAFIHIGSVAKAPNERPRPDYDDIVSEWHPEE